MGQKENRGKKISVCMIVRDEESNLARCLGSVREIADEIIVADTGSKDGTREIARRFEARVMEIPWTDDFSEARNASIKEAAGDWILVLDADEELPQNASQRLRLLLSNPEHAAYTVRIRSKVGGDVGAFHVTNTHTRLFKNRSGIYYSGRIHEDIRQSVEAAGATIGAADIELIHYGYTEDAFNLKSKADRNLSLLEKMKAENPSDGHVLFYLGESYSLKKDWENAARFYGDALSKAGLRTAFRALAHQNLATAYLRMGRRDESRAEARKAIETDRRLPAPHLIAGAAAFEDGLYDLAIFHINGYLDGLEGETSSPQTQPVYTESGRALAYELLGRSCYHTNNFADALRWFGMWRNESGDLQEVIIWLARAHGAAGDFSEAEKLLGSIAGEQTSRASVAAETGMLRAQERKYAEAMNLLREALDLNPYSIPVRVEMGKVYLALKKYPEACEILEEAWQMGRRDLQTGQLLAESYLLSGRYREAGDTIRILRREGYGAAALEYLEGLLAKQNGDMNEAERKFINAMEYSGQKPEFYFACGNVFMELARYEEAIQAFEKAIHLAPSVKEPYYNAGVAYIRQKKYREAIEKFEMVLRLEPDSKQTMRTLAGLYGKIGEMRKAETYLYNSNM